jgi:hypothetical protein
MAFGADGSAGDRFAYAEGLPIARTRSPTSVFEVSASVTAGRLSVSTLMTAMSVCLSPTYDLRHEDAAIIQSHGNPVRASTTRDYSWQCSLAG